MRKRTMIFTALSIMLLIQLTIVVPVFGITQATPDENNTYGYSGMFAVDFGEPNLSYVCSGVLISPTVFLTAGHCLHWLIGSGLDLYVTFDKLIDIDSGGRLNNWITTKNFVVHPLFGHDQGNIYDLGIIFLPEGSTDGIALPTLTTAGLLDDLFKSGYLRQTEFTSIGYGLQMEWERGPYQRLWDGWRNYASAPLMALTQPQITLNINEHATGGGGACNGDSGGPILLPVNGRDILVGITTERQDKICRAMTAYYRIDTPWAREFLGQFVTLP